MNFSDGEIVASILNGAGFGATRDGRWPTWFLTYLFNQGKKPNKPFANASGIQEINAASQACWWAFWDHG